MVMYSYAQLREMADRGELQPEQLINDTQRGLVRADAIPEVAAGFASRRRRQVGWALAGVGLLGSLIARKAAQNAHLRDLPWEDLRTEIFRRDNYTCAYCGHRGNSATLEVDHEMPVARGGTDDPSNLTTACWECNRAKGTMTASEYRWHRLWHS